MLTFTQLEKKTLWELVALATPMVVSQGAFAIMIFTDRYFMSLLSPIHMSASLGGGVTSFFCLSLFIGLISYANALVAQYYGAGERHKCPLVVTQSVVLSIAFIPLLAVISYLAGQLFAAMGHVTEQVRLEKSYFYILMWGAPLTLIKTAFACYFSGIGRTRTVMVADILGVAMNIPMSYLLIFGLWGLPELGIAGAALGTIISTAFSMGIFAVFYFARHHREQFQVLQSFIFAPAILRRHLRLGFPSGLELFLNVTAFNLFLLMFQSYGVAQGASAAIVLNWDLMGFIPMLGLNIAIISLVGRFIGAGDITRVNQVIRAAFLLGLIYSGLLAVLFITFRGPLVEVFMTPGVDFQEIRDLSTYMMVGLSVYVMGDAIILVSGGVLRGAGDTRWLLKASATLHWAMLLAQFVVIKVLAFDPRASWNIFVILIISIATVYLFRLHGEKWRHPEVLGRALAE